MSDHIALGRALAPLRSEGVFILGSGNLVHNLGRADLRQVDGPVDAWAKEFDAWCAEAIEKMDLDALADYRAKAPGAGLALPTDEHFTPILVAAAAAAEAGEVGGRPAIRYPHEGIEHRNISMRCVEFS